MPHLHDKIDFTVETFIVHNNRVLLRMHDKYKIWLSVGGHVELDEDPTQAAIREVQEEVGLSMTLMGTIANTESTDTYQELLPPRFLNRHRISETHEHITFTYFATTDHPETRVTGDDVSPEWKWFSQEELNDPQYHLKPNILFYATQALQTCAT